DNRPMNSTVDGPVDLVAGVVDDGRIARIELDGREPVPSGRHRRTSKVKGRGAAVSRPSADTVLAATVDHVLITGIDQRLQPVAADVGVPSRPAVGTVDAIVLGTPDEWAVILLAHVHAVELSKGLADCRRPLVVRAVDV